jgi:hypothetical protein
MSELSFVRGHLFGARFQSRLDGRQFGVLVDCFFDKLVNERARRGLVMHKRRGTKDRLAIGRQTNIDLRVFATHLGVRPCYTVRCSTPRVYLD